MSGTDNKLLKIELGLGQSPLSFHSIQNVIDWVQKEKDQWKWASEIEPKYSNISNANAQATKTWANILQKCHQHIESKLTPATAEDIATSLRTLNDRGFRLVSSDPRSQYVKSLFEKDPYRGNLVFGIFIENGNVPIEQSTIPFFVEAAVFNLGLRTDTVESSIQAAENSRQRLDGQVASFDTEATRILGSIKTQLDKCHKTLDAHSSEYSTLFTTAKAELDEFKEFYNNSLAISSPVNYWSEKAEGHFWKAIGLAIGFGLGIFLAGGLLALLLTYFVIPNVAASGTSPPQYWPLAVFVASAAFLVWPLRIVSKLMLSSFHLKSDADERVTMAKVYLALLKSDDEFPKVDRAIILNVLFRSASTGIVKEDKGPSMTFFDHFMNSGDDDKR